MKKPNFFILGAPKCGTTSMASWLAEHPNVYFSPIKEPHHFDIDHLPGIKDRREYERLFAKANSSHMAIGEASVRYLHSEVAVSRILEYSPMAKFIVMVRNPVEMAASLHEQYVFTLNENIEDFEAAWRLQPARKAGEHIPPQCVDPKHLQYGDYCKLGEQVDRLLASAPSSQVLIIFMEDLASNEADIFENVTEFLGVPRWRPEVFRKLNSAKKWRSRHLATLINLAVKAKISAGLRAKSFGIGSAISQWNRVERPRPTLNQSFVVELKEYFREDVKLLAELTGRPLQHWIE